MLFSRRCLLAVLTATGLLSSFSLYGAPPSGSVVAQADGVTVHDAWARASAGSASTGVAYVTLVGGSRADQLVGVSTPIAATAEVHQTRTENGVMKMRAVPGVAIPAGRAVTLAPGGTHIMLMGLKQPLAVGQGFPLTLTFAHAPPVTVDVSVRGLGGGANGTMGDHMDSHDGMPMP